MQLVLFQQQLNEIHPPPTNNARLCWLLVASVGQNRPVRTPHCCLLLPADSPEEEYNRKHASAHLYKGEMDTVQKILTFVTCLTRLCLRSLHHRFVTWTKPDTTSLLLGTLIDLSRSKSELVAENALLPQQLIILRRQVKRPVCTKMDRMLLV